MSDWNTGSTGLRDRMVANFLKVISWFLIGGLILITFIPASGRPITGLQHHLEHFAAFALTGLIFGFAYAWQLRTLLSGALVFTLLLEVGQIPLPTRHARLEDFVVNAVSVCLGVAIGWTLSMLWRRRRTGT